MPASKWNMLLNEILDWIKSDNLEVEQWLSSNLIGNPNPLENQASANETPPAPTNEFPKELPILPLRGLVVYPQTAIPLTVGQPRSIKLVDDVVSGERLIGLVASRNPQLESPGPSDLYQVGTIGIIHRLFRAPDGTIRLLVQGLARFKIIEFVALEPYLKATVDYTPEIEETGIEVEALARNVREQFAHIADMIPSIPRELVASVNMLENPLQTVYTIGSFQRMSLEDAQTILEYDTVSQKLRKLVGILTREIEVLELGQKIQNEARSEIEKVQREYFLREQIKAAQRELGEGDEQAAEIEEFKKRIETAGLSKEAEKQARRELDRLSKLPTAAAEYGVIRTYLDWLLSLPWAQVTEDNLDILHARQILDRDHYGLEDVKERILEFLAVRKLRLERKNEFPGEYSDQIRKEREGVILCFVGPPGVGKTSLGQSIAYALGRKFIRISLGGLRDEAEIRGHRRTYIGAMPGRILQTLRRVESRNPVFMMDEIDKLSFDFHGDPASALLEVLDPEQNREFVDHYLEVPFDLSQVMFITTANQLETIPGPLLDRMEIIHISGYTEKEKIAIASQYLVPRQLRENGLRPDEINFTEEALKTITRYYTREAGVRNLEREIGSVCRKVVTNLAEGKSVPNDITKEIVEEYLGRPKYLWSEEIARRTATPGVAIGLAWTPFGGDVLFIEATAMPGSKGFQITGSVGKVMQESAQAALSYIRTNAEKLGIDPDFFQRTDLHLHIPAGAQPKDGPSAGVTMTVALASLLMRKPVRCDVGMTGEITLSGQVLPVGGVKEKVLAAHRSELKTVILPRQNEPDLVDVPDEVKNSMQFVFVESLDQVLQAALDQHEDQSSSKPTKRGKAKLKNE